MNNHLSQPYLYLILFIASKFYLIQSLRKEIVDVFIYFSQIFTLITRHLASLDPNSFLIAIVHTTFDGHAT